MNDDRIMAVQTPHVPGRSMAVDDSEPAQQARDEAPIRVALIRHAESVANTQLHVIGGRSNHSPLTAAGEQQAVELGEKLKAVGYSPDVIYSSPAVRTLETARIALAVTGYPKVVQVDDRLQELEQGEWTGRLRADTYTPRMSARIARSGVDFAAPGGESMRDVGQRMHNWLRSLASAGPTEVLAFTHGVAIRCLAGLVEDWPHERVWKTHTANCSVTVLEVHDQSVKVRAIGTDPEHFIPTAPEQRDRHADK